MLNAIVRFSLKFRGIVVALACALIGYGSYTAFQSHYDIFPEFAPPQVVIQTQAPGLAPEQVEQLVTLPVETAINGASGIESLRSGSVQGLSVVTITFRWGIDVHQARQEVAERLTSVAGQLPQGVEPPLLNPLTSSTSVVLVVGLSSEKRSLMDVTTTANWTVRPRLLAVPGVSKVVLFGGEVQQAQVQLHPEKLLQYNLALDDVLTAARRATGVRGAGFIDTPNQRIVLQTEGQAASAEALAGTVLLHGPAGNVTLGDVADVIDAPAPPQSASLIDGRPGVMLVISSQYGANTLAVSHALDSALQELRPALERQDVQLDSDIFRPARFIRTALSGLRSALLIGAGLVVLVLFVFLFEWRTALISCTAIPLSLLSAVVVLRWLGQGLDTMTLGGLAIAIGEVVDDAVIDVENILRRLRENAHSPSPQPAFRVVLDASIEVRHAVVYATFAVILVFLPVLTLSGVAGRLFAPLGIAYVCAVLASLLVALTVTPALSLLLLRRHQPRRVEPPVVTWLKAAYIRVLQRVERRPRLVIGGVVVATLAGTCVVPFLGGEFLPQLNEGHFILHVSFVPGTSLAESLRIGKGMSDDLLKLPYVRSVSQHAGRAAEADDVSGTHESEFEVDLKPLNGEQSAAALAGIRETAAAYPGVNASANGFLVERIEETLSGQNAAVVVNVVGSDLDVLDAKAQEVAQVFGTVGGAVDVRVQSTPQVPQLSIRLRQGEVARWGFEPVDVLDALRTAYQGEVVGQVYQGNRVTDVSVILDEQARKSPAAVGSLRVRNSVGNYLPLNQLADIFQTSGRYLVLHDGARRVQVVTANVQGRDVASVVADARQRISAGVTLPAGTYVEFSGAAEAQSRSTQELLVRSSLAALGIVLLLSVVMGHWRNLLLVLLNLPLALVGGVLAVFLTGGGLSLGSLVGFVTLFGITLRNSIMLVSHYEHLVAVEGRTWGAETAIEGAAERLAPILMTALVTGLGLLPLALGAGEPGKEIEGPLAIVILGGLFTSTALNLLVLPTLALRFGRFSKPSPESEEAGGFLSSVPV